MEDYPRNLVDLERLFASDDACRDYLMFLRWPDGFRCPRCGGDQLWPQRITLLQCAGCDYQSSVIAGRMFQDTHTPLTLWFGAIWYVTSLSAAAEKGAMLAGRKAPAMWLHNGLSQ